MRKWLMLSTVARGLAVVWALTPAAAFADISGTPHDFSAQEWSGGEVCRVCHVPHNPVENLLLWNHELSSNSITFGDSQATTSGTSLPTNIGTWSGTTKYCLSCHDGSVAIDSFGGNVGSTYITGSGQIGASGDLKGNHPVAIPYPDQPGATYNSITTGANPSDYVPSPTGVKVYGTTAGAKGLECGSCHEPHDDTIDPFLRVTMTSSALCASCHKK